MTDENLKSEWVYNCLRLAGRKSYIYAASIRKIVRTQRITFEDWDDSLNLDDLGYHDVKMSQLKNLYRHEESHAAALELWHKRESNRKRRNKFQSVVFSCHAHDSKRAGISGKQGPCLSSVTVTHVRGRVEVDAFWRSTEILKKFAGDLVFLRDELLKPFGRIDSVTCHIANVTVHPLYFLNLIPQLDDPLGKLQEIEKSDHDFHQHIVNAMFDQLRGGTSNANFQSSHRVVKFALANTDPKTLKELKAYLESKATKKTRRWNEEDECWDEGGE